MSVNTGLRQNIVRKCGLLSNSVKYKRVSEGVTGRRKISPQKVESRKGKRKCPRSSCAQERDFCLVFKETQKKEGLCGRKGERKHKKRLTEERGGKTLN